MHLDGKKSGVLSWLVTMYSLIKGDVGPWQRCTEYHSV